MTKKFGAKEMVAAAEAILEDDDNDKVIAEVREVPLLKVSNYNGDRMVPVTGMTPLNKNELTSVRALLAYVSHNQNRPQATIDAILAAQFNVDRVDNIPQRDYQRAIEFLVDLRIDDIIN